MRAENPECSGRLGQTRIVKSLTKRSSPLRGRSREAKAADTVIVVANIAVTNLWNRRYVVVQ
jgi:hypothetical protein